MRWQAIQNYNFPAAERSGKLGFHMSGDEQWRQLIENFFCNLKDFRCIALRSDKTDTSFSTMIHACAALINSR